MKINPPLPLNRFASFEELYRTAIKKNYFDSMGQITFIIREGRTISELYSNMFVSPMEAEKSESENGYVRYIYTPQYIAEQLFNEMQVKKEDEAPIFHPNEVRYFQEAIWKAYGQGNTPTDKKLEKLYKIAVREHKK